MRPVLESRLVSNLRQRCEISAGDYSPLRSFSVGYSPKAGSFLKNAEGAGNLPRAHPSKGGTKFSRHGGAAYSCALSPLRVQDEH